MDPALESVEPAPVATSRATLEALIRSISPVDERARTAAAAHHDDLTKPRGSLGRLESLGAQLSAISGLVPPTVPVSPAIAVFAGDHGVVAEGVTPWPAEVTAQMVANFCAGGAAINALARRSGATMTVVDVGVASELVDHEMLRRRNIRAGTANLAVGPAMSLDEAVAAMLVGAEVAAELVELGADLLVGGEMGIGNTTPSAAVIAALTGRTASEVTGRGTGIDDAALASKIRVVDAALTRSGPPLDPIEVVGELGGLELAALAGFYLGAGAASTPVVVDGVIATAAALVASALCPDVVGYLVAGHRSSEPGATIALAHLGLVPLLDLGLRLGEGSGAALAIPVIQAAAGVMVEMATFGDAGVSDSPG